MEFEGMCESALTTNSKPLSYRDSFLAVARVKGNCLQFWLLQLLSSFLMRGSHNYHLVITVLFSFVLCHLYLHLHF